MKRIANKVALQTILYCVSGNQRIEIVDYSNTSAASADMTEDCANGTVIYSGLLTDLSYYSKALKCECHGIKIYSAGSENIMVFKIVSAFEQF